MNGPELIEALNVITQEWGIGYEVHLGDTALGIKGRIGFHAGAALMLIQAHRELEKLVLTHQQSFWKDHLANFWGNQLHIGQIFDPVMQDIQAMINSSQKNVIGITRIQLRPGHFHVTGIRSSYSLLDTKVAKYGEDNKLWTGEEARAFAKISAIPSLLAYKKGNHDY
jgi:argininosuccinate synthase